MSGLISRALEYDGDPAIWAMDIQERATKWLPYMKAGGADLLVGVWVPPKEARLAGSSLFVPEKNKDENQYQGISGLILLMGPHAYKTEKTTGWFVDKDGNPSPPKIGDWVQFDFLQGKSFLLGGLPCRWVADQYVMSPIPRPDIIA